MINLILWILVLWIVIRDICKYKYIVYRSTISTKYGGMTTDFKKFRTMKNAEIYEEELKIRYPNDAIIFHYL